MTLENLRKALLLNNIEMLTRLKKYFHVHENLATLDKLAVSEDGHFTFEGASMLSDIDISQAAGNAIEKKEDGYYVSANNPSEEEIQKMIDEMWKELMQNNHHFSTQWTYDNVNHWRACTDEGCTEVTEKGPHTYDAGVVTSQPDYDKAGIRTYTCTVCGQTKTEAIMMLEHNYDTEHWTTDSESHWHQCTDAGYTSLYKDKAVHDWDEGVVTTVPTFEAVGTKTYTCSVCNYQKTEDIPQLNHAYATDWSSDDDNHWRVCTDEGYSDLFTDKAVHSWNEGVVTKEPAVGVAGEKTFTCTVCGRTRVEAIDPLPEPEVTELKITQQPSDSYMTETETGWDVSFSIKAEGEGLTYQWYEENVSGTTQKISEGGTGTTKKIGTKTDTFSYKDLTQSGLKSLKAKSNGVYCVVTDANGNTVTSEKGHFLFRPLTITKQPEAKTFKYGEEPITLTFTVEATGDGVYCDKWYYTRKSDSSDLDFSDGTNLNGFDSISGSNTNTLTITGPVLNFDKRIQKVFCLVKDAYGTEVWTDYQATVTLERTPLTITKQPENIVLIREGDNVKGSMSVEANGDGLTYQWWWTDARDGTTTKQFNEADGYTGVNSSTMQIDTTLTSESVARIQNVYCIIDDAYGYSVVSDVVTVTESTTT